MLRLSLFGARIAISASMIALMVGCGSSADAKRDEGSPGPSSGSEESGSVQTEQDGTSSIERIDINGDQKADVFKFFRVLSGTGDTAKRVLIRKEMDVNFDQKIDIVQYFAGEAGKEVLVREEMDLDFDGRVDETRHYKDGHKSLVELDMGFDGRTDTWRYYQKTQTEDGRTVVRLVEKRRDTDGDGTVDVWEYYTAGSLQKIGYDTNGDGSPDRFTKTGKK
jgi:hypothetical protein